jgi:hypothetical protein
MAKNIPFEKVLEFFEKHGYKLYGFWRSYRVFRDPDDPELRPWFVQVEDGMVSSEDFEKIEEFFS